MAIVIYGLLQLTPQDQDRLERMTVAAEATAKTLQAVLEKLTEPPTVPHDLGALAAALKKKDDEVQAELDRRT